MKRLFYTTLIIASYLFAQEKDTSQYKMINPQKYFLEGIAFKDSLDSNLRKLEKEFPIRRSRHYVEEFLEEIKPKQQDL